MPDEALIPQFSESCLLPCRRGLGAKYFEVEIEPFGQFVDETIGLREEVARVEQDDGQARHDRIHEMQHDGRLGAEARGQYMLSGKKFKGALDSLTGREVFNRTIEIGELRSSPRTELARPKSRKRVL